MQREVIQHDVKIKADAAGNPPTRIHLLSVGEWECPPPPWGHGNFEMKSEDLREMVDNFHKGVGLVEGSDKAPINYGHDVSGKAAGWIVDLTLENGDSELWGDVEWTPNGVQMLTDKEFRYISPEWNPRAVPYIEPEDENIVIDNVFTGAGLTNIPLFKKLKPIMASILQPNAQRASVVNVSDNQTKGEKPMDLAVLRAKNKDELSEDELKFVAENSTDLTVEERKAFDLQTEEDKAAEAQAEADAKAKEEEEAAAAAKAEADAAAAEAAGKGVEGAAKAVSISADRLAKLEADAAAGLAASRKLAETEAKSFIASAVGKGQIKSGEADKAVTMLLASSGAQRTQLEEFITGLPVNESLGKEFGDGGVEASTKASEELHQKVSLAIRASAEKGKTLSYVQARRDILAADASLKERVTKEEKEETK